MRNTHAESLELFFFSAKFCANKKRIERKQQTQKLLRHVSTLIFGCSILLATLMYDWQLILVFFSFTCCLNFLSDRYFVPFDEVDCCWLVLALHLDRLQFGLMSRDRRKVKLYPSLAVVCVKNQFSISTEMLNQIIRRGPPLKSFIILFINVILRQVSMTLRIKALSSLWV